MNFTAISLAIFKIVSSDTGPFVDGDTEDFCMALMFIFLFMKAPPAHEEGQFVNEAAEALSG